MLRRRAASLARWLAAALVLALAAGYAVVNLSGHDPARWHVDPAGIALRGTPNEVLAAPPGTTAAEPHIETRLRPETPRALLARFDAVARAAPRTRAIAGSVADGMLTYVQRSAVIGFPDYVTAKAVPAEDGAALVVYSRSRYGHGDFGVNRARVERWLGALRGAD